MATVECMRMTIAGGGALPCMAPAACAASRTACSSNVTLLWAMMLMGLTMFSKWALDRHEAGRDAQWATGRPSLAPLHSAQPACYAYHCMACRMCASTAGHVQPLAARSRWLSCTRYSACASAAAPLPLPIDADGETRLQQVGHMHTSLHEVACNGSLLVICVPYLVSMCLSKSTVSVDHLAPADQHAVQQLHDFQLIRHAQGACHE